MLRQDNILTKLVGERNFLFWIDGLKKLSELVPKGTSNYKIAMLVRGSIENAEDKKNTQGMNLMEDSISYVNQRYIDSPNLLNATLSDIRERRSPKNYQQAVENISATMTMGRLLENVHILRNVENSQLAMLESKCIMMGTRRELYVQKQIENLMADTTSNPGSSTPILNGLDGTINEAAADPGILDGSMVRAQNGGDAEKRR